MQLSEGPPDQKTPPPSTPTKEKPQPRGNMLYWLSGISVAVIGGFLAQGTTPQETSIKKLGLDRTLNVVLFSYLPFTDPSDPNNFYIKFIQDQFDTQYPDYKGFAKFSLDPDGALYDATQLNAKLQNGDIMVAEIDTIMLGDIVGNISPWQISDQSQFYQVGLKAGTSNSVQYGIPRMLCSNFLFTYDKDLYNSATYQQFQANIINKKGLGYHLNTSYGFANYFDNYLSTHNNANQAELQSQFDNLLIEDSIVKDINSICIDQGWNMCLDNTDSDNDATNLQNDKLTAYVGYYETASNFPKDKMTNLLITPMIKWKPMLMFTDVLVKSKILTEEEKEFSNIIAKFLTQQALIRDLMEGKDLQNPTARYFMPAVKGIFEMLTPGDRLFDNLKDIVTQYESTMVPIMSSGWDTNRKPFKNKLVEAMSQLS